MSNEITVGANLRLKDGVIDERRNVSGLKVDQTTLDKAGDMQTIGTATHEAITVGDVTTPRWVYLRNADAANFVQIGLDVTGTFYPFAKLLFSEVALFPIPSGITLYAKADTASVKIDKLILDT